MKSNQQLDALVDKLKTQLEKSQNDYDDLRSKESIDDADGVKHEKLNRMAHDLFGKSSNDVKNIVKLIDNLSGDVSSDTSNLEKQTIRDQFKVITDELMALKGVSTAEKDLVHKYIKAINDSLLVEKRAITHASDQLSDYIKQNFGMLSIVGVLTSNNKLAMGMGALAANATKYVIDRRRAAKIGEAEKKKIAAEGVLKEVQKIKDEQNAPQVVVPEKPKDVYIDDLQKVDQRGPKLLDVEPAAPKEPNPEKEPKKKPTKTKPQSSTPSAMDEFEERVIERVSACKEELEDLNITTYKILDILDGSYKDAVNNQQREREEGFAKVDLPDSGLIKKEEPESGEKQGIVSKLSHIAAAVPGVGGLIARGAGLAKGALAARGITGASGTLARMAPGLPATLAGAPKALPNPAAGGVLSKIGRAGLGAARAALPFALPTAAVAAAGYAGVKAGGAINDGITGLLSKDGKERTLGSALYDWTHPEESKDLQTSTPDRVTREKVEKAVQTSRAAQSTPVVIPIQANQASPKAAPAATSSTGAGTSATPSTPGGTRNTDAAIIRIQNRHAYSAL